MKAARIFFIFATHLLLLISLSAVHAADNFLLAFNNSVEEADIDQCVKELNLSADDSLEAAERFFQVGMCHFCADCELDADNGELFLANVNDNPLVLALSTDRFQTTYKLFSQAAVLGEREAYYGLAVLLYISDLSNKRNSKNEANKNNSAVIESLGSGSNQAENNSQKSIDTLITAVLQETSEPGFSQQIHNNLLASAKLGYLPAQFALSEVYFKGMGVPSDKVQAYAWAATAVSQNPPFGSQRRDDKAANFDNVELNAAEALAEEYMKKYTDLFLIVHQ